MTIEQLHSKKGNNKMAMPKQKKLKLSQREIAELAKTPNPVSIELKIRGKNEKKTISVPVCEVHWKGLATKKDANALKKIFLKGVLEYYKNTTGKKSKK